LLFAIALVLPAAATAPDVFSDELGSYTSASCDSAWTGDCLSSWSTNADDDSLSMAYCLTQLSNNDYGVTMGGTGINPNGVYKTFDVTARSNGDVRLRVKTFAISSTVTATVRVEALNSSFAVVQTITGDLNTEEDASNFTVLYAEIANSNVEYIRVRVGVTGSSELWVDEIDLVYEDEAASDPESQEDCEELLCKCDPGWTLVSCRAEFKPPAGCMAEVSCSPPPGADEPEMSTSSWTEI
jgi:hypothetical protein